MIPPGRNKPGTATALLPVSALKLSTGSKHVTISLSVPLIGLCEHLPVTLKLSCPVLSIIHRYQRREFVSLGQASLLKMAHLACCSRRDHFSVSSTLSLEQRLQKQAHGLQVRLPHILTEMINSTHWMKPRATFSPPNQSVEASWTRSIRGTFLAQVSGWPVLWIQVFF